MINHRLGDVYLDGRRPVHVDIDIFLSLRKGDTLTLTLDNHVFVGTVIEYRYYNTELMYEDLKDKNGLPTGQDLIDLQNNFSEYFQIVLEESGEIGRFSEPNLLFRYTKTGSDNLDDGHLYVRYPGRRYNVRIFENRGLLMKETEYNQSWSEKRALPQ